jgi:hypothetical protein
MGRIGYTISGAFAGAIVALLLVLATRENSPAYAAMQDNAGSGLLVAGVGGPQTNITDTIFVIYRRPVANSPGARMPEGIQERITMATYRIEPGRYELTLENIRDLTADLELANYSRRGDRSQSDVDMLRQLRELLQRSGGR